MLERGEKEEVPLSSLTIILSTTNNRFGLLESVGHFNTWGEKGSKLAGWTKLYGTSSFLEGDSFNTAMAAISIGTMMIVNTFVDPPPRIT